MPKPEIVLFSPEISFCSCFESLFNTVFKARPSSTEAEFLQKIQSAEADAAVVCLCSAQAEDVDTLLRLESLAGPLPVLTCSARLNPQFVQMAAQKGVNRFLLCSMEKRKIQDIIFEAIEQGGLKAYLESCCPGGLSFSPHIRKMVEEVVHAFPHRLHKNEMAQRLGISRSWLRKTCREAFGVTFTQLVRRIWIHQALRLMQHTNLDNTDIALHLNYSEESSMARDFRKTLGYNPTKARRLLTVHTPKELLK